MKSMRLLFIIAVLIIPLALFNSFGIFKSNLLYATDEDAEKQLLNEIKDSIRVGKDINIPFDHPTDYTFYARAVYMDSEIALYLLIENGLDLNAVDHISATQLHRAAQHGSVKAAKIILEYGLSVNCKNKNGDTPLAFSAMAKRNQREIVELLIKAGAIIEITDNTKSIPLVYAAFQGNYECVSTLLDNGADINREDQYGITALHTAARHGWSNVVKLLLDRGANVNATDKNDETPLYYAGEPMESKYASQTGKVIAARIIRKHGGIGANPKESIISTLYSVHYIFWGTGIVFAGIVIRAKLKKRCEVKNERAKTE